MSWNSKLNFKLLCSQVILFIVLILYLVAGAFLFQLLERAFSKMNCYEMKRLEEQARIKLRENFVKFSVQNSSQVNATDKESYFLQQILTYRDVFKVVKYSGLNCFEEDSWNFLNTLLYCVTILTSIGYGQLSLLTDKGKITLICYATIGIPLFLIFITRISNFFAKSFRRLVFVYLFKLFYKAKENKNEEDINQKSVPLTVSMIIIFLYIMIGVGLFNYFEDWSAVSSAYFCFITLATIGFGDKVPGQNTLDPNRFVKLLAGSVYILIGLAVITTCFDLVQEELISKFIWLGKKLRLIPSDEQKKIRN